MGNNLNEGYINKIKGMLFGILKEKEKGREWEHLLNKVLSELIGFNEEQKTINYYILWYKLSALKYLNYKYFRSNIFDAMELVMRMKG